MPESIDRSSQERPSTVPTENVAEKPKLTPEQEGKVAEISESLKKEHEMLTGELEQVLMTPPIANEEKIAALFHEMQAAGKAGDETRRAELLKQCYEADKQHKSRTYKVDFLKKLIDQNEVRLGLPPERKLALARLSEIVQKQRGGSRISEETSEWMETSGGKRLKTDAFAFSEDGSYTIRNLTLGHDRSDAEALMNELPNGLSRVESAFIEIDSLDLAPSKMTNLKLRRTPARTLEEKKRYTDMAKRFLSQEREITGHAELDDVEGYGSYGVADVAKEIDSIPDDEIRLKIGKDHGYHWVSGNGPMAERLQTKYPY